MDVILLEKVRNLGVLGDKVSVRPGYGRNFLIPFGKAVSATKANSEKFIARRDELMKKAEQELESAKERATQFNVLNVTIEANASDEGKLYGSVGTLEIQRALAEAGQEVEKREIMLPNGPFHEIGDFEVDVLIHTDVTATVRLSIKPMK